MGLNSIRRLYDYSAERNIETLRECRAILLAQFPYMDAAYADALLAPQPASPHPFAQVVLIAESRDKAVMGVAVASHFQQERFFFLDFIAAAPKRGTGGIGAALYERLREEARLENAYAIVFDCLPDRRQWCTDDNELKQNKARLRFYEKYGARPLMGTPYETPRADDSIFHLVFDGLGATRFLSPDRYRRLVRTILEAKAAEKCSPEYIERVVSGVKTRVELRPFQYVKEQPAIPLPRTVPADKKVALVVNEGHLIHHVKERGYLESPVRVTSILKELDRTQLFERVGAQAFADRHLLGVHDADYVKFLKRISEAIGSKTSRYGDVFPIRNAARLPRDVLLQIGYYCIDASTPLNANAYTAARAAVNCALTAATLVKNGRQLAYALTRPPGHHAERRHFGGFCYLNSTAVAAQLLSHTGRVAILDVDYHHGNGQQNIFYERADVFTVSLHADPEFAYPNFTGFADEQGAASGAGFNLNLPLPRDVDGPRYHTTLQGALERIKAFQPSFLVVALGLDVAKGDPTGTWSLLPDDFCENGRLIAGARLPTLVVQEGGYKNKVLGTNARRFFQGLWDGYYAPARP